MSILCLTFCLHRDIYHRQSQAWQHKNMHTKSKQQSDIWKRWMISIYLFLIQNEPYVESWLNLQWQGPSVWVPQSLFVGLLLMGSMLNIIFQPLDLSSHPVYKPANHLDSPPSAQRQTERKLAVCLCWWGHGVTQKLFLLLFPVTISPVFHKPGHDLLMHVFKKFMNWSEDGAVPTTARLFFPLSTQGQERRHFKDLVPNRDTDG